MAALRNPKHEVFAQHVAAGVPAVEALALAGFKTRLPSNARRLRNSPHVRARIEELWADAAKLCGVAIGRTLMELSRIAYARLPDLFERDGDSVKIKNITALTPDLAAAVRELKIGKDGQITVKLHDKVGALGELTRYLERAYHPDVETSEAKLAAPAFDADDEWHRLTRSQPSETIQ